MNLQFFRSVLRRRTAQELPIATSRLTRFAQEGEPSESPPDAAPAKVILEPAVLPLYDSSVYHSRLEELPTFVATFLSEAAEEQIAQLMEGPASGDPEAA
jgi:hypothetical protein